MIFGYSIPPHLLLNMKIPRTLVSQCPLLQKAGNVGTVKWIHREVLKITNPQIGPHKSNQVIAFLSSYPLLHTGMCDSVSY